MSPPITDSIKRIGPYQWLLGSATVLTKSTSLDCDAIASWRSNDGATLTLSELQLPHTAVLEDQRDTDLLLVHQAGTASAVWELGAAFCKVKAWDEHQEMESATIEYVNQRTSIPVPKIIHSWVDKSLNRSFLILERVDGMTLNQAWPMLPPLKRVKVANKVAEYCSTLASLHSDRMQSACGSGILEPFLTVEAAPSEPSWKPNVLGPFSGSELKAYLCLDSGKDSEETYHEFYFMHMDLTPGNIMVSEDGTINGILDWESAGFYPPFWVGTKPLVSPAYLISGYDGKWRFEWRQALTRALANLGMPPDEAAYRRWEAIIEKKLL